MVKNVCTLLNQDEYQKSLLSQAGLSYNERNNSGTIFLAIIPQNNSANNIVINIIFISSPRVRGGCIYCAYPAILCAYFNCFYAH